MTLHHDVCVGDNLRRMHGRRHRRRGLHRAVVAHDSELEVGKPGALTGPSPGLGHGDAPDDEEVDWLYVPELDSQPVGEESLCVFNLGEVHSVVPEDLRVEQDERGVLDQLRHRSVQLLASSQRRQPERALRRVRVALDNLGCLKLRQLAQSSGGFLRAFVVGNGGPRRADSRSAGFERAPDPGTHLVLGYVAALPPRDRLRHGCVAVTLHEMTSRGKDAGLRTVREK